MHPSVKMNCSPAADERDERKKKKKNREGKKDAKAYQLASGPCGWLTSCQTTSQRDVRIDEIATKYRISLEHSPF